MSPEERLPWDELAAKDKQRYLTEKAMYTGDWKVEKKRMSKDSRAPKRPPNAFLYFSGEQRGTIKEANPGFTNTDTSKELGRLWREMSDDQVGRALNSSPNMKKAREDSFRKRVDANIYKLN